MKIHILPEVHAQIMYYVNKSNIEISGLGRIQKASNGDMVVSKIYLLDQKNTATTTDLDKNAVADLQFASREDKGDLNFWWHSHVNMAAFWSGTDMATIKEFGAKGYLLATVFNKKGEYQTAYFQGSNGFLPELFMDKLETSFAYLPMEEEIKTWEAQYEEKAKEKKWTPSTWTSGGKAIGGQEAKGIGHYSREDEYEGFDGYGGYSGRHYTGDAYDYASSIPSSHRDPSFYEVGSKADEETAAKQTDDVLFGASSGLPHTEIAAFIRRCYHSYPTKHKAFGDLEMLDVFCLYDVYEILYGFEPAPEELLNLYDQIISSRPGMLELVYDFLEEVEFQLNGTIVPDKEEPIKTIDELKQKTLEIAASGSMKEKP